MPERTVLVVDDDAVLRESLCESVSDLGYRAAGVHAGLPALSYVRNHGADLVVSDVDMPDISGFELVARLRVLALPPPVVLMSARADQSLCDEAHRSGAMAMLAKPIPLQAFTGLVSRLLPH
jgi:two-component system response regulator FlrC